MVLGYSLLWAYVAEHIQLLLVLSTHTFFLSGCAVETRELPGTASPSNRVFPHPASDCGRRAGQVGRLNSRGLFNAGENPFRGDRADQRQTDPISAKPVPQSMQARHSFAVL